MRQKLKMKLRRKIKKQINEQNPSQALTFSTVCPNSVRWLTSFFLNFWLVFSSDTAVGGPAIETRKAVGKQSRGKTHSDTLSFFVKTQ
jgi:hypothetical protein